MLQAVTFKFPDQDYGNRLFSLLAPFGLLGDDKILFTKASPDFYPNIAFCNVPTTGLMVQFELPGQSIDIEVVNKTGEEKLSPEKYSLIPIEDFVARTKQWEFVGLDHVGFNLPWFDGLHPDIAKLREEVAPHSAYYLFPTGEDWDFILPATEEEIDSNKIDLSKVRRPKLEIVSFEKASTPLIQIDLSVRQKFEDIVMAFPEGIADSNLKNVWVYLTNPYGIDICLVVGEHQGNDWSGFFEGHRLASG